MTPAFFDAVHADPWARELVDLAPLNASASGAVEAAIEAVRKSARNDPHALRSTSLVVLGPPGAGKTHLFARLRRRVGHLSANRRRPLTATWHGPRLFADRHCRCSRRDRICTVSVARLEIHLE